jgi:hypothetical protein
MIMTTQTISRSHAKSESRTTIDHDEIKRWVEKHGGKPVHVKGTGGKNDPGMLRIDFPGGAGADKLEPISWEEWFEKFEERKLSFLYQEKKATGEDSTFFKLVSRSGHGRDKAKSKK